MKKLVLSLIALAISLCLMIFTVYAWFSYRTTIRNFIITTGDMEAVALLYKGQDFDKDSILDVDINGNDIYTEVNTSSNYLIENLSPGDYVTFKLNVQNTGDFDGTLNVYFGTFSGQLQDVLYIDSGLGLTQESQILSGAKKTVTSNVSLSKDSNTDIIYKFKFATLSQLQSLPESSFSSYENLNAYESETGDIKTLSMVITVELLQYVE